MIAITRSGFPLLMNWIAAGRKSFIAAATGLACWLLVAGSLAVADDKPTGDPAEAASLDQQLLESLSNELLEGLTPTQETPAPEARGMGAKQNESQPQPGAQTEGTDGEDFGTTKHDPLAAVGQRMRKSEQLLKQREFEDETVLVQKQIVSDLESLIEQLKCQQCQGGASGQQKQTASKSAQKKPSGGGGQPGGVSREGAARESTQRRTGGETQAEQTTRIDRDEFARQLWGDLPDRTRQQMLNSSVEQFLPEYQDMIEKYFRRLVEQQEEDQ